MNFANMVGENLSVVKMGKQYRISAVVSVAKDALYQEPVSYTHLMRAVQNNLEDTYANAQAGIESSAMSLYEKDPVKAKELSLIHI